MIKVCVGTLKGRYVAHPKSIVKRRETSSRSTTRCAKNDTGSPESRAGKPRLDADSTILRFVTKWSIRAVLSGNRAQKQERETGQIPSV